MEIIIVSGLTESIRENAIQKRLQLGQLWVKPDALHKLDTLNAADVVYVEADNTRKARHAIYNQVKELATHVGVLFCHRPYQETDDKIDYVSQQIPRIGYDCDSYEVDAPDISTYHKEMTYRMNEPHNSVYHMETINEHIQMVVDSCPNELKDVGYYHDLGKCITREQVKKGVKSQFVGHLFGEHNMYVKHELVSACYYVIANQKDLNDTVLQNAELIMHHMRDPELIKPKTRHKYLLDDAFMDKLKQFRSIDANSRHVKPDLVNRYVVYSELKVPQQAIVEFENDVVIQNGICTNIYNDCSINSDGQIVVRHDGRRFIAFDGMTTLSQPCQQIVDELRHADKKVVELFQQYPFEMIYTELGAQITGNPTLPQEKVYQLAQTHGLLFHGEIDTSLHLDRMVR